MAFGPILRLALVRNVPQCRRGVPQPRTDCSQGGLVSCIDVFTLHGFQIPILVKFTRGYDCIHCTYTCCNNIWKVRCCKRSRSLEVFVRVRQCKSARRKVVKPIKRSRVDGELQEPDANQSPRPGYQEGYSCRVQRAQSLSLRG